MTTIDGDGAEKEKSTARDKDLEGNNDENLNTEFNEVDGELSKVITNKCRNIMINILPMWNLI